MDALLKVAFSGGGSGGHLTPAMGIAEALCERRAETELTFLTSGRDIDRSMLSSWRPLRDVSVFPLPVRSSSNRLRYCVNLVRSVWGCIRLFRRARPDVVLGLGGFASVPGVIAARWHGIPVALLETNTVPGRANRRLAGWAVETYSGWYMDEQYRRSWPCSIIDTGVPLIPRVYQQSENPQRKTLLVLGGSLGARRVNEIVPEAVSCHDCLPDDWEIIHQCGSEDVARVTDAYGACKQSVVVEPFIEDMAAYLNRAQLVVSRAGAVTLAEIAHAGRASILLPMSHSADLHQQHNASMLEQRGAAVVLDECAAGAGTRLAGTLASLTEDSHQIHSMESAVRKLAHRDAAERIADRLISLASGTVAGDQ